MKKKILILGGSGYIGTVLIKNLVKRNLFNVTNIDNLIYGGSDRNTDTVKKSKLYSFHKMDIRDIKTAKFIPQDLHTVVILFGLVGDPITAKYKKLSHEINRKAIINAINFFKKKKIRLIFISTCSNYGLMNDEKKLAKENTILKPLSLYAKDKVFVENFLQNNKQKFNFDYTILRFSTAFGISPRMRFDLTIRDFAHQIYFKKKLDVYDPYTWRPYCHVEDLSNAIIKVILAKKNLIKEQVFNVGVNNNNFTKKKIVEEILKFKNNTKINYLSKGSDPRNYRVDFSKIKKKLNFKCKWTVADGIKELLVCFKKEIFKNVKKQGNYNIIKKII